MFRRPRAVLPLFATAALLLPSGCGPDAASTAPSNAAGSATASAAAQGAFGYSTDPRARELRALLEVGAVDGAAALLAQIGPSLGNEQPVLAARLAAARGDALSALTEVERARQADPRDPRPYATAAEIYAGLGRLDAAKREYERGLALLGPSPELTRALGVIGISTPGGVTSGLVQLEQAQREAPELPFLRAPLAEANLLVGRVALLQNDPATAQTHAEAGLALLPGDGEIRRLLGESLAAQGEFAAAAERFEELLAEGQPLAEELARLHHGAATTALKDRDRARAIEHYLRARELGYDREALGFGASVLDGEADKCLADAREAYGRAELLRAGSGGLDALDGERAALAAELEAERLGELGTAQGALERALTLDPERLEALDLLGSVHLRAGRAREAALAWEAVWARLDAQGDPPPYPVHLNAARAWEMAERVDLAAELLRRELARDPKSEWAETTRVRLAELAAAGPR
ncbi:MAG: hypothetical protein GC161_17070 [Planctomycetaceae bacterium]|nr:hypothetical protein [Planctomycetaceae bacterium]